MKSFDEYWNNYEESSDFVNSRYSCAQDAFEAGQQSKQAEVDELRFQRDVLSNKVDELKKKLSWANDVASRESSRANSLQEDNVRATILLGKCIQEKELLQKRIDKAIVKWVAITSIVTTHENNLPDEFYQKLDGLHCALILKGDQS